MNNLLLMYIYIYISNSIGATFMCLESSENWCDHFVHGMGLQASGCNGRGCIGFWLSIQYIMALIDV
jgi:hypothetical protein